MVDSLQSGQSCLHKGSWFTFSRVRVPTRYYTGLTSNVDDRIASHNSGTSPHTASGCPWRFVAAVEFATQERAVEFERYLKSGSGRAFAKRHFR